MELPAPTMSHLICTGALIILIFTMQFYYMYVVDNIWEEMVGRELKEIADYVSDTLANLYFLANSTKCNVTKTLNLPSDIRDATYMVEIEKNATTGFANYVHAYLKDRSTVGTTSWLLPGLVRDDNYRIESGGRTVVVGCSFYLEVSEDAYVWIAYG